MSTLRKQKAVVLVAALCSLGVVAAACSNPQTSAPYPASTAPVPDGGQYGISAACNDLLDPIRAFMTAHVDSVDAESRSMIQALLEDAYDGCTWDEYREFRDTELSAWMLGAHNSATSQPSDPGR